MILDQILEKRKEQLAREIAAVSRSEMISLAGNTKRLTKDFLGAIRFGGSYMHGLSVIAEVKKASPSKGLLQPNFDPAAIAAAYEQAGANAISVLTEEHYFQGSSETLRKVRRAVALPILRKDFVFDDYQLYQARAMGADAALLIASLLPRSTLQEFLLLAQSLCLNALVEVHDEAELNTALACGAILIGINNRNLKTFEVSLETTKRLAALIPKNCVLVSESGISSNADMKEAKACGAHAVLIGETLMRSDDIAKTLRTLREGV